MLYFFLSYARGDEDELVRRFYEDLSTEVRLVAGSPQHEQVGFLDKTMLVGERWPQRVADALATCRSFVALMTPRYFQSEHCGKEWQMFAERTRHFETRAHVNSSLLKPLIWIPTPPERVHHVASAIQHSSDSLGDLYPRLGVRQLMRLQRHQDDYRSFLFELARQIVAAVETHTLPGGPRAVSFGDIHNAFSLAPSSTMVITAPADAMSTPMLVHFVVAAFPRRTMGRVREDLTTYGDSALDWAPYLPPLPSPLVDYAREIAAERSFACKVASINELARRADAAIRFNQIVVLLVDAWATKLEPAQRALAAHRLRASRAPVTTAVLIPCSRDDAETRRHWPNLSLACRRLFEELAHDDELYRSNIVTHRAFEEDLPGVLEAAKNRLHRSGHVMRPLPEGVSTDQPHLDGTDLTDRVERRYDDRQ